MGVKIIRFLNGEEILATIVGGDPTTVAEAKQVTFTNPVRILVVPPQRQGDKAQVALAPWTQFSKDKTFTVSKAHVFCIMDPLDDFVNEYRKIHGGIVIPTGPGGLLLPTPTP